MQAITIAAADAPRFRDAATALEAYAKGGVQTAIGKRLAFYSTLKAVAGADLADWISDGSIAENEQATIVAGNVARAIRALDTKQAVLVPWMSSDSNTIHFAIAAPDTGEIDQSLRGLWPLLAAAAGTVLFLVSPGAAIVGAGIYLVDAYLSFREAEQRAQETLARTRENLTNALALAQKKGDGVQAAAILEALRSADAAASKADPSWIDRILGAAKSAAVGAAGGFGLAAAVILFLMFAKGHQR